MSFWTLIGDSCYGNTEAGQKERYASMERMFDNEQSPGRDFGDSS